LGSSFRQPTNPKSSRLAQFTPIFKGQLIPGTDYAAVLKTASWMRSKTGPTDMIFISVADVKPAML
jgi:hypothetical protein